MSVVYVGAGQGREGEGKGGEGGRAKRKAVPRRADALKTGPLAGVQRPEDPPRVGEMVSVLENDLISSLPYTSQYRM